MKGRYEGEIIRAIMLLWVSLLLCCMKDLKNVEAAAIASSSSSSSSSLESEMEAKLKLLNKAAVKSIKKKGRCPKGTVPIRRIRKEDLVRHVGSLHRFGKQPISLVSSADIINNTQLVVQPPENRSAACLVTMGYNYIGASADINVWNPNVEKDDEFTTAQIWLKAGSGSRYFENVEAGWMVNPKLYGDKATRLFACWTRDSYTKTGCFDLTCPGFVQVSSDVALGAALEPISSHWPGQQYDINVEMYLDPGSGNWWLEVQNMTVGYWPAKVLSGLRHSAIIVEWGGQVFSSNVKNREESPHTGTGMGSGEFANGLFGNACFMKNVRIKDYSLTFKYPEFVSTNAQEPYCYNTLNYIKGYGVEPVFYFGGPGRHPPYCP